MMKRTQGAAWFLLLALALAGATLAVADADCAKADVTATETVTAEAEAEATTAEAIGQTAAAMRVVIDPETGRLRAPTEAEMTAFAAGVAPARDIESMRVEKAADGTMTVRLGGAFLKAAMARVAADGSVEVQHDAIPAEEAPAVELAAETAEVATAESTDAEENR